MAKLLKGQIEATYWGANPMNVGYGFRKYAGLDYLFAEVYAVGDKGGRASSSQARSKVVPEGLQIGKRYLFSGSQQSNILRSLKLLGEISNPTKEELKKPVIRAEIALLDEELAVQLDESHRRDREAIVAITHGFENSITKALKKAGIHYEYTKALKVIRVLPEGHPPMLLTLNAEDGGYGTKGYKFKVAGSREWVTMSRLVFLATFGMQKTNTKLTLPFGKHKGKTLLEVDAVEPSYLVWLSKQDFLNGVLKAEVDVFMKNKEKQIAKL